jgi:hypothetical protein
MTPRQTLPVLCAFLALSHVPGCGRKQAGVLSVKDELRTIGKTVDARNPQAFFQALSEKQKVGHPEQDIKKVMEENAGELKDLSSKLKDPKGIRIEAYVSYWGHEDIVLVAEEDDWTIDEGILDLGKNADPADALSDLMEKVILLREVVQASPILSQAYRKDQLDTLDAFIDELNGIKPGDIVIVEDHGFVIFPSGRRVELVLEDGEWKITRVFPLPFK